MMTTPRRRFVDFDIKLDADLAPEERFAKLKELKQGAHRFLREAYPKFATLACTYGDESWGHWYADRMPVRVAGTGAEGVGAVSIDSLQMPGPAPAAYWDIHRALQELGVTGADAVGVELAALADRHIHLNKSELACPDFDLFPIRWPDRFRRCEINTIVRLAEFDPGAGRLSLEKASYLDSSLSNLHCDEALSSLGGRTLRQLASRQGGFARWTDSPLANGLGVACLFLAKGRTLVFNDRKGRAEEGKPMAVMKAGMHVSSSGVLEWQDICRSDGNVDPASLAYGMVRGMVREITKECGIPAIGVEGVNYRIAVLEMARELPRAGKPQIFFVADFDCDPLELKEVIIEQRKKKGVAPEAHEYGEDFPEIRLARDEKIHDLRPDLKIRMTYEAIGAYRALADAESLGALTWRPAADFSMPLPPAA